MELGKRLKGFVWQFFLSVFRINAEKPFHLNVSFWAWMALPLFVSVYLGWPLAKHINWVRAEPTYSFFLELYKLPLWVASFIIVLGIMNARMHSSKQQDRAIRVSKVKNDFDLRFKHEEEFKKFAKNIPTVHQKTLSSNIHLSLQADHNSYLRMFCFNEVSIERLCIPKAEILWRMERLSERFEAFYFDGPDKYEVDPVELYKAFEVTLDRDFGIDVTMDHPQTHNQTEYNRQVYSALIENGGLVFKAMHLYLKQSEFMNPDTSTDPLGDMMKIVGMYPTLRRLWSNMEGNDVSVEDTDIFRFK